jgi:hypothetical protein
MNKSVLVPDGAASGFCAEAIPARRIRMAGAVECESVLFMNV